MKNIFEDGWPQHDSTSCLYLGVSQCNSFQKKEFGKCLSAESQEKNIHISEGEIKIDDCHFCMRKYLFELKEVIHLSV